MHGTSTLLVAWMASALWLAQAQPLMPPSIEWQRSFGSSSDDRLTCMQMATDQSFVMGGFSETPTNGTKTCPGFGVTDLWIVRVEADGDAQWDRCYGGTTQDECTSLQQTEDGGFILGGIATSGMSGNKTTASFGGNDYWVVRVDPSGMPLWDRTFGGSVADSLRVVRQTHDGGFILGGDSSSGTNSSKMAPSFGNSDFWVVRLDSAGNKIWDRSFGGSGRDELYSLEQTPDGGFILGGASYSPANGNKTSTNFGSGDFWLVRLDPTGNKLWEMTFGGTNEDSLRSLQMTADGGLVLGGFSYSPASGNKTSTNYGGADFWVVRLDAVGAIMWENAIGGATNDILFSIAQTAEGGWLLAGESVSAPGQTKTAPSFGGTDGWVVRLSGSGEKLWDDSFGGTLDDRIVAAQPTRDGGCALAIRSFSGATGNKTTATFGFNDYWLVKLGPDDLTGPPVLRWERCCFDDPEPQWSLLLSGSSNLVYSTEVTTNLVDWIPLRTNQVSASEIEVFHSPLHLPPQRFFRARLVP